MIAPCPAMRQFRAAVEALCPTGAEYFTTPQLADLLGISGKLRHNTIRQRLRAMARRGELEKSAHGTWRRTGKEYRRGEGYARMWRAIRSEAGVFAPSDIVRVTRMERSTVYKYLRHLEDAGLVEKGPVNMSARGAPYRITPAGRSFRETPYPPRDRALPCRTARAAAAALVRLLLLEDADLPGARRKIREHLAVLNREFRTQDEKKECRQDAGAALSRAEGDGREPETALSGEATSPTASVPTGRGDRALYENGGQSC